MCRNYDKNKGTAISDKTYIQSLMACHPFKTPFHLSQLSRIIRESPGYRTNLPVSHTVHQISRIKASLDIFYYKIRKIRWILSPKYCVFLLRMVVLLWNFTWFWFTCIYFSDFQFVWETGSKSKKRSMKKFRGAGWGYVIQNQISPDFRFPEVGISAIWCKLLWGWAVL